VCFGSGQSLPQSLTSVAPARRFKKRIIASVRLFTQPGPTGDIIGLFDHLVGLRELLTNLCLKAERSS
jgi:hypothetical protein